MYGRHKGGRDFWDGIRNTFPDWEHILRNNVKTPPEKPQDAPGSTIVDKGIHRHGSQFQDRQKTLKSSHSIETDIHMLGGFRKASKLLLEIYDSEDPIFIRAIVANLQAFRQSVRRQKTLESQSKEIEQLNAKCDAFEEKLKALEKRFDSSPASGKRAVAG